MMWPFRRKESAPSPLTAALLEALQDDAQWSAIDDHAILHKPSGVEIWTHALEDENAYVWRPFKIRLGRGDTARLCDAIKAMIGRRITASLAASDNGGTVRRQAV